MGPDEPVGATAMGPSDQGPVEIGSRQEWFKLETWV